MVKRKLKKFTFTIFILFLTSLLLSCGSKKDEPITAGDGNVNANLTWPASPPPETTGGASVNLAWPGAPPPPEEGSVSVQWKTKGNKNTKKEVDEK